MIFLFVVCIHSVVLDRKKYSPSAVLGRVLRCSADAGEVVAALPFGGELEEEALHGVVLGGVGGEGEGFAAGELEEFFVAQRVGDVKAEVPGLAGAEKLAGSAEEEIGFGDFKTVGGAHHGFEAGAGDVILGGR